MNAARNYLKIAKEWLFGHKKTALAALIVLLLGGYGIVHAFTASSGETKYVQAAVEKGSVITSISGTGQVSASNEIELTSKASGQLVSVNVTAGQTVRSGQLIASVDARDAAYELESTRIAYDKLVSVDPTDLDDAKDTAAKAQEDLDSAYADARASLTAANTDLTDTLEAIDEQFGKDGYLGTQKSFSTVEKPYRDRAVKSYNAAKDALDSFQAKSRSITTASSPSDIESAVNDGYEAALLTAQAVKDTRDAIAYIRERDTKNESQADAAYTTVSGLATKASGVVSDLSNSRSNMTEGKRSLKDADQALDDLKDGPDTLDLRSETLSLREKQKAYDDYFTYAPFDGVIASVDVKKGENVTGSTKIGTIITKQKIAEISLNEVDASKVAVGQKATLTFDAIDGLTITGTVAEMDLIGTVEQGVVSYTVKVGFDTDDDRIKPGMTASADIVTAIQQDVLVVPTSSLKTSGDVSYVEVLDAPTVTDQKGVASAVAPHQVEVSIGLAGDDTTEILSGLSEGHIIVTRTIAGGTTAKKTTTTAAPSLLGGSRTTTGATRGTATGGFQAAPR